MHLRKQRHSINQDCKNCGAKLTGPFCAQCGQENVEYHASVRHVVPEVLIEFFGFDSQIFRSVPALLFHPGLLTAEFIEGRRAKYISPIRLYLIVSAIFFFTFFTTHRESRPLRYVMEKHHSLRLDLELPTHDIIPIRRVPPPPVPAGEDSTTFYAQQLASHAAEEDQLNTAYLNAIPTAIFLLMPIFALLLMLMFRRAKKFYVAHLIFSFHVHTFTFVVVTLMIIINVFISDDLFVLAVPGIIAYLAVAMRRVYGIPKWLAPIAALGAAIIQTIIIIVLITATAAGTLLLH